VDGGSRESVLKQTDDGDPYVPKGFEMSDWELGTIVTRNIFPLFVSLRVFVRGRLLFSVNRRRLREATSGGRVGWGRYRKLLEGGGGRVQARGDVFGGGGYSTSLNAFMPRGRVIQADVSRRGEGCGIRLHVLVQLSHATSRHRVRKRGFFRHFLPSFQPKEGAMYSM
jgi:hypothetical protein